MSTIITALESVSTGGYVLTTRCHGKTGQADVLTC